MAKQGEPAGKSRRGTKQRMTDAAVALLRERGAAGVTIEAVIARSGAPRGSIYHHFPGGRDEMVLTAARESGDFISRVVAGSLERHETTAEFISAFVELWKDKIAGDEFAAGCPVVAMTIDHRADLPEAGEIVDRTFSTWQDLVGQMLEADGFPGESRQRLATTIISAVEGAIVLARAHRSSRPLDDVATVLTDLLRLTPTAA